MNFFYPFIVTSNAVEHREDKLFADITSIIAAKNSPWLISFLFSSRLILIRHKHALSCYREMDVLGPDDLP